MINKSNKFRLKKRRLKCWNGFTFTGRFELAPADRVPEQMKRKLETITNHIVQNKKNILVVSSGNEYNEMVIPVLSPDPSTNKRLII
jgi:hypothetical protein